MKIVHTSFPAANKLHHMNKAELAGALSERVGVTKKQAEDMLDYMTQTITNTIKAGGEVTLTGFGTFSARVRKGREGVNPQNPSEKIQIPPTLVVKFKAGKTLKDALKAGEEAAAPSPAPEPTAAPSAAPSDDTSDDDSDEDTSMEM